MTRIIRWNPVREMVDMQRRMDQVFNEVSRNFDHDSVFNGEGWLSLDVIESEDGYSVRADLPGLTADDINITLHDNVLTISGEIEREDVREGERHLMNERYYGAFRRSVRLPDAIDADAVEAEYHNGVLTLTLPRSEAAKPRQIAVKNGAVLADVN